MDTLCLNMPEVIESCCGRKRLRMEQNQKKKKIKIGKDRGDAYFTYRGKAKVPKKIQPITCFCVFNCRRKVTEADRKRIFESFYAL